VCVCVCVCVQVCVCACMCTCRYLQEAKRGCGISSSCNDGQLRAASHLHTPAHTHTYTCTHTYTHLHTHTPAHTHTHTCTHTYTHLHTHLHTHTHTHTCAHTNGQRGRIKFLKRTNKYLWMRAKISAFSYLGSTRPWEVLVPYVNNPDSYEINSYRKPIK